MKDTLETLRNALLIMAVLWLAYVLYKRLLNIMGKAEVESRNPPIDHALSINSGSDAILILQTSIPRTIQLEVRSGNGEIKIPSREQQLSAGDNRITLDLSSLGKGRYYYKICSEREELSQYFELI